MAAEGEIGDVERIRNVPDEELQGTISRIAYPATPQEGCSPTLYLMIIPSLIEVASVIYFAANGQLEAAGVTIPFYVFSLIILYCGHRLTRQSPTHWSPEKKRGEQTILSPIACPRNDRNDRQNVTINSSTEIDKY